MKLLNIGCGANYHPSWINLDVVSTSSDVIAHDIRRGLPFSDASFDAVFHSHVIEHLAPQDALVFMRECVRVLRPGGRIRVATPDLETMARIYLNRLEAALQNVPGAGSDHYWMTLELFDQMVRSMPGGEMGRYLRQPDLSNKTFIISRIGQEAEQLWDVDRTFRTSFIRLISFRMLALYADSVWKRFVGLVVYFLLGKSGHNAFKEGIFRNSGEIHRWLYDRFSLARLLDKAGLVGVSSCSATESGIPDFNTYQLDVLHGVVRKPDSFFMEATKPL